MNETVKYCISAYENLYKHALQNAYFLFALHAHDAHFASSHRSDYIRTFIVLQNMCLSIFLQFQDFLN